MRFDIVPNPRLDSAIGILFAAMLDGTREWQGELGEPPVEAIVWQPFPDGPSIGGLILHIISCERYWLDDFVNGAKSDPTEVARAFDSKVDQYVPYWPAPPAEPIGWYYEQLAAMRAESLKLLLQHRNAYSAHHHRDEEVTYRWIVAHLTQHDSYHGGQMVLLHEMWKKRPH